MDRTEEFRRVVEVYPRAERREEEDPLRELLGSARSIKESLHECFCAIDRASSSEYGEIEKRMQTALPQAQKIMGLLKEATEEENMLFVEGVVNAIRRAVHRIEVKVEEKRYKRRKSTLNVALEAEKAPVSIRHNPKMMQMLHEENKKILEHVQYTEKEVFVVRKKISEIDTLQKLISQEIFTQDERIDVLCSKTATASIDVKISKTYIKSGGEKRKAVRQFLALLIFIITFMMLLMNFSR